MIDAIKHKMSEETNYYSENNPQYKFYYKTHYKLHGYSIENLNV